MENVLQNIVSKVFLMVICSFDFEHFMVQDASEKKINPGAGTIKD